MSHPILPHMSHMSHPILPTRHRCLLSAICESPFDEQLKKRYGTVFRESGAELRGTVRKRFKLEPGGPSSFCLDFEEHRSLVTPRPGLSLDGSMGVVPPRTQALAVLYEASGGELLTVWIAPDTRGLGGDPSVGKAEIEATELWGMVIERIRTQLTMAGGEAPEIEAKYVCYLEQS